MLSCFRAILIYLLSKKVSLFVLALLVSTALSTLSLYAIGYVSSLSRVYDVFYPRDAAATSTIIISSDAISPFTSLINFEYIKGKLSAVDKVEIQPIFITVGLLGGEPTVLYETPIANDTCLYPSTSVLSRVGPAVGSFLPIQSLFTGEVLILRVCGIGDKPGLGVSYSTIARLRGVKPGYYSFAVAYIYDNTALNEVYRALGLEAEQHLEGLIRRAFLVAIRRGDIFELRGAESPTEIYFLKLGIYRDYIIYAAYSISVVALLGLPVLGLGIAEALRGELKLFVALGASRRALVFVLLSFTAVLTLISVVLSLAVYSLNLMPPLIFLDYSIPLEIGIQSVVYTAVANYTLCAVGAVRGVRALEV
ncbi:MAG: hypothetical protein QXK88_04950 [Desulfurococcaceae archaeon]